MNMRERQAQMDKEDNETGFWDKTRIATERVLLCVRDADLVEITTSKFPVKPGTMQWEVTVWFVFDKQRHNQKIWFQSTQGNQTEYPTRWDRLFSGVTSWPAHNILLVMNVPGEIQKGFHVEYPDRHDSECACKYFPLVKEAAPVKQIAAPTDDDVSEILEGMGFEPAPPITIDTRYATTAGSITEAQQRALLALSANILNVSGERTDPGDFAVMSEGEAAARIVLLSKHLTDLRRAWMTQSAAQHKTSL